jgi:hypothetical protein
MGFVCILGRSVRLKYGGVKLSLLAFGALGPRAAWATHFGVGYGALTGAGSDQGPHVPLEGAVRVATARHQVGSAL